MKLTHENNSKFSFHGDCENGIVAERRRVDVSMCKAALLRYVARCRLRVWIFPPIRISSVSDASSTKICRSLKPSVTRRTFA